MKSLLVIGSVTRAMRAKEVLDGYSIFARVRRVSDDLDSDGCRHGVVIDAHAATRASEILRKSGIRVTSIEEIRP